MLWPFTSALLAVALVTLLLTGDREHVSKRALQEPAAVRSSFSTSALYPVDVISIVDGDSFRARIALWPGQEVTTLVRVRGIDTPEKKARCRKEREFAEDAQTLLAELASEGFAITDLKPDKYGGRVLATVLLPDGTSVADHMLATGSAREYRGKKRMSWCA
jgi:micrococcal nuclease